MKAEIFPFSLGFNDCYVIREQGTIMIDGGPPDKKNDFIKVMKSIPLEPDNIRLIVVTDGIPTTLALPETSKNSQKQRLPCID